MQLSNTISIDCKKEQSTILSNYRKEFKKRSLASLYPEIAKQWHKTKNKTLTPEQFTPGSGVVVWWKCDKGHEYDMEIQRRLVNGCPYCSSKRIDETNSIQTLFPEVAKEWDFDKNDVSPNEVAPGSAKKYHWKCQICNHQWEATPNDRTRPKKPSGCPECAKKKQIETRIKNKIKKEGSLFDNEKEIAKEWHPNKNHPLTAKDVLAGSSRKVWWLCKEGHEWEMAITYRTGKTRRRRQNCPECSRKNGAQKRRQQLLQNGRSLKDNIPELAKQWHIEKNGDLTPSDVTFSSTKEVWWRCEKRT